MHTSTVTLLLGLGGCQQTTSSLQAHYIVMNSNVRVDQHKSQTTEGESRRTVGGLTMQPPSCVILEAVTKKLTHRLQNSQLHVCDEQKMSDKGVWNSLKVHKGLSSSL